jgi:hypothetical protein
MQKERRSQQKEPKSRDVERSSAQSLFAAQYANDHSSAETFRQRYKFLTIDADTEL